MVIKDLRYVNDIKKCLIIAIYILALLIIMNNCAEAETVKYIDSNGREASTDVDLIIKSSTTKFNKTSGWIAGKEDNTFETSTLEKTEDLNIILCDGASLTIKGRIFINSSHTLTIYSQKEGTGKLILSPKSNSYECSIAGPNMGSDTNTSNYIQYGGSVTINSVSGYQALAYLNVSLNGGTLELTGKDKAMKNVNLILGDTTPQGFSFCISSDNYDNKLASTISAGRNNIFIDDTGEKFSPSGDKHNTSQELQYISGKVLVTAMKTLFNSNNAANNVRVQYFTSPDDTTLEANSFTSEGYEFNGWNTQSDGKGTSYQDKASINPADLHNKTLYAQWKAKDYAINYNLNGGTNAQDNPTSYMIEDSITLKEPSRTGYTFTSWAPEGNIPKGSTGDKTFTANWTPNKYTVNFHSNYGTDSILTQEFTYDTSQNLTANTFTRTGYTFNGWNTDSNGTGTNYTDGQSVTNLSDQNNAIINLYAKWQVINYSITYELNGGSVTSPNPERYNIESETFTLNNPSKQNYDFTGWTGTDLSAITQTVTINKGSTGDRTYTANYEQQPPVMTKLSVNISGSGNITLNRGASKSENYSAAVTASYSYGDDKTLSENDYSLTWTLNENISGITINNNGVLTISNTLEPGTYDITINAQVSSQNVNVTKSISVNILVKAATLKALDVSISGTGLISLDEGSSLSADYFVMVNASYSDGTEETLSKYDYDLVWSLSEDIPGISINDKGSLIISNELKSDSYDITIIAQVSSYDITETVSKSVTVSVNPVTLKALDVTISGSNTLTLDKGTSKASSYSATVKASYSDNTNKTLTQGDYVLKWNLNENISGIAINDEGKLTVNNTLKAGTYKITINAQAVSQSIKGSASMQVSISVNDKQSGSNISLKALSVTISGTEAIALNAGTSTASTYSAQVKAAYSNGTSKILSERDYVINWSLQGENISGIAINNYGRLTISDSLKPGTYNITVKAQAVSQNIEGSTSMQVRISVNAKESHNNITIKALSVTIAGSEAFTLNAGTSTASTYSAQVKAYYSDNTINTLTESDYAINWTLGENISGIAINNHGVLIISDKLKPGSYDITINAQAEYQDFKYRASKQVSISVINQESSGKSESELEALDITISGAESLTLNAGTSTTAKYSALATAYYSNGMIKTLSEGEYALTWSLNEKLSGIAINDNGELIVNDSLEAGNYYITIRAQAEYSQVTVKAALNINIFVKDTYGHEDNQQVQEYDTRIITAPDKILTLSPEAKNAVTYLELNGDIHNLSDIDFTDFTSLITLDLSKSQNLETADLSILPDTVKEINLSGASITSLNLTGCNVQIINAQDCENLEYIDAQGLSSLLELDISNSPISSLNLTDCVNLVKLICSNCELDSEGLMLDGCSSLQELDISNNHFMYFDNIDSLEKLKCSGQEVFIYYASESNTYFDLNRGGGTNSVINITAYGQDNTELAVFYDTNSGLARFEAVPSLIKYEYVTGFKGVNMDVKIYLSGSDLQNNSHIESRGGCNLGFNLFALSLLVAIMLKTKINFRIRKGDLHS